MLLSTSLGENDNAFVVSNLTGDYAILSAGDHMTWQTGQITESHPRYFDLLAKSLIDRPERGGKGLEQAVLHTRKASALEGPSLHIFVVTLRCDHACAYCQVSRAAIAAQGFDMSIGDANAAIERVFESPAQSLTIEFQGGEPALRFDLIRHVVERVIERNAAENRHIHFSMVSVLHHLSDDDLAFCATHNIHISTSIDGPAELHNWQRPNPGKDAWMRTVEGLGRARSILGHDGVVAMPTLTRAALVDPKPLIDTYVDLGFRTVFLRPMSPYGFARKTRRAIGYEMSAFVDFYERALGYILELNNDGVPLTETYSAILLRHILTPFGSNYVDLRSPAGAGLAVMVYNYDGKVYPSDEARMAAETGDHRFALGRVEDTLDDLLGSPAMIWLASGHVAEQLPHCQKCAFLPFCGADPVYHAVEFGAPNYITDDSAFCQKHMGLFRVLFRHLKTASPETMKTFISWAFDKPREVLRTPGFIES